jgi:hypothetical protein
LFLKQTLHNDEERARQDELEEQGYWRQREERNRTLGDDELDLSMFPASEFEFVPQPPPPMAPPQLDVLMTPNVSRIDTELFESPSPTPSPPFMIPSQPVGPGYFPDEFAVDQQQQQQQEQEQQQQHDEESSSDEFDVVIEDDDNYLMGSYDDCDFALQLCAQFEVLSQGMDEQDVNV